MPQVALIVRQSTSNLRAMITTKEMKQQQKLKIVAGVSMLVGVPLILHQRKRWPWTAHEKGLKNWRKGGTVVHGGLKH